MPRANQNKLYRTFVRGLITEAGYLTYPEDSSSDELNTVLFRKGNRARRLGISYGASSFVPALEKAADDDASNEFVWKAVNNIANTNFLCVQTGNTISFFDLDGDGATGKQKSFSILLSDHLRPGGSPTVSRTNLTQFGSGKGLLFVVNEEVEPLAVKYNPDTDTITTTEIKILIRDFDGLEDGLKNDEEPSTLSKEHHYNLMNQGWVDGTTSSATFSTTVFSGYQYEPEIIWYNPRSFYNASTAYQTSFASGPIATFYNALSKYPGNNKQWWVARAEADDPDKGQEAGDFLPLILNKLFSGSNRAPQGHFVLDAFKKDRRAVSGITDIETETIEGRPNAVAFFSGRSWWGYGSTVYYSQILNHTNVNKAGICHQEADPTAEDISELIATDGGVVPIPEIDKIVSLVPMANGVLVFALNGVWFISGGDAAFSATNISVSKVSPIGTNSPLSIVETDGQIYWWSETGINALEQASGQFGPIPGKFGNTNISEQTVQSFWDDIPPTSRERVKACYDTRNNVIHWLYQADTEDGLTAWEYDASIQFDLTLQSFYPWKFSNIAAGPRITGLYMDVGYAKLFTDVPVTDSAVVVTDSSVDVTVGEFETEIEPTNIFYVVNVPGQGLNLAQTNDQNYSDWKEFDGTGLGYESYIETGYEIHADTLRDKQVVYLSAHFKKTETEVGDNPSSCYMTTKWDWSNRSGSNKWSNTVQVYRPRIRPNPTTQELVNGFDVVTSKNKVRGSGKAVQFRFGTDEIGKTFDLLGWSVAYVGNTQP